MQNKTPKWKKGVNQPQKKVREDVPLLRVVKACEQCYRHVGNFIEIRCDISSRA